MYFPQNQPDESDMQNLALLESVASSPAQGYADDPEVRAAFDASLRELAQDILTYHPGLAHLLLGMSEAPSPVWHGQN